ncbi:MAG: hypothetical protein ACOX2A_03355 [Tepidanaerobacteraceae bacterium]
MGQLSTWQGEYPTIIGNNVTIGHGAIIHACKINDGAFIGMGAIILDGAGYRRRSINRRRCFSSARKTYTV